MNLFRGGGRDQGGEEIPIYGALHGIDPADFAPNFFDAASHCFIRATNSLHALLVLNAFSIDRR